METQKKFPLFLAVLQGEESINFALGVLFHQNSHRLNTQAILSTSFLKNIVCESSYKEQKFELGPKNFQLVQSKLVNRENLLKISNCLFFKNLILSNEEIEKSLSDEEHDEIFSELGHYDIDSNLFNASTSLVISLFENYSSVFIPIVLECYKFLQQNSDIQNIEQFKHSLLKKECLYHVVGLGSFQLYDHIDFSGWFTNQLVKELEDSSHPQVENERKMLKRRIIWMIGKWVSKIGKDLRIKLYPLLLHFLSNKQNNKILRFETAKSLTSLISDYDFVLEDFFSYVNPTLNLFLSLINEMENPDTITYLFSQFELILEQLGGHLSGELDNLFQNVVILWKKFFEEETIQSSLLRIVCQIVKRSPSATKYYSFLLPLIKHSTFVENKASIYLMEDGLDLWVRILKIAPELNQEFVSLYSHVFPIISSSFSHYKSCVSITEAYLLLGGKPFLSTYIKDILNFFDCVIGDTKDKVSIALLNLLDTFVLLHSSSFFPSALPLFQKILGLFLNQDESIIHRVQLLYVLYRFISVAPNVFFDLIKVCSQNQNPFILFSTFLEKTFEFVSFFFFSNFFLLDG